MLLRWGQTAFQNFRVVPPDTGIVHQVNLEYLAPVVFRSGTLAYPDSVVGTGLAHHDGEWARRAGLGRRRVSRLRRACSDSPYRCCCRR